MKVQWLFPFIIVLGLIISGCQANQANSEQHEGYRTQQANEDRHDVEERLEHLAEQFPQVKSAHCVLVGQTAIVGLDVDGALERAKVDTIKYTVAEAIQNDPYGAKAWVTADMDLNQRLKEIAEQVRQGHPVAGFAGELADMIGRMMPQSPMDTKRQQDR